VEEPRTLSKVRIHVERVGSPRLYTPTALHTRKNWFPSIQRLLKPNYVIRNAQKGCSVNDTLDHEMFFTDKDEIYFIDTIVGVSCALNHYDFSIVPRD
jgi:hypothetical protein